VIASGNAGKIREFAALLAELPIEIRPQPEGLEVEETGVTFAENARLKASAVALATGCWALADDSGLAVAALGGAPGVHSARYAASDGERIARLLRELAAATAASSTAATAFVTFSTAASTAATETTATTTAPAAILPAASLNTEGAPGERPGIPSRSRERDQSPADQLVAESVIADRSARFTAALAVADPGGTIRLEVEGHCPGLILEAPRGAGGFGYDPVFLVPELGQTFAEMDKATKGRIGHRGRAFALLEPALRQLLA
jgi:non-canonical purine NTP pyrophosphatase (RdgB/HAM1 family)